MEKAFAHYWAAKLQQRALVKSIVCSDNIVAGDTLDHAAEAIGIYLGLLKNRDYCDDPLIDFRIAQVLALQGRHDLRIAHLERAAAKMHRAQGIPENAFVRVLLPRSLSGAYWQVADQLKKEGERLGFPDYLVDARQEYYRKAFRVLIPVLEQPIDDEPFEGRRIEPAEQRMRSYNNALDAALEFLRAGGTKEELASDGFSEAFFKKALVLIGGEDISRIEKPTVADTVRLAYKLMGEREKAKLAARRVLTLLERGEDWNEHPDTFVEEMRRDALECLES
jgi:hypothetical protein